MPDRTQTLSMETDRKRIETVVPYLEAGAEDALSAAGKSARENHPELQTEYLNERDALRAFAAELRIALSQSEHQGDEVCENCGGTGSYIQPATPAEGEHDEECWECNGTGRKPRQPKPPAPVLSDEERNQLVAAARICSNPQHWLAQPGLAAFLRNLASQEHRGEETAECERPPEGRCTRKPGHDGPCAAVPTRSEESLREVAQDAIEGMTAAMFLLAPDRYGKGGYTPEDPRAMAAFWNDSLLPILGRAREAGLEANPYLQEIDGSDYEPPAGEVEGLRELVRKPLFSEEAQHAAWSSIEELDRHPPVSWPVLAMAFRAALDAAFPAPSDSRGDQERSEDSEPKWQAEE